MRIFDGFLYFNEADLLDIRMHELRGVVDYSIIVEAAWTFRGHIKAPQFARDAERIEDLMGSVLHIPVLEPPESDPWRNEAHARDAISRGLLTARSGDLVLVSDVDEIVRPEALEEGERLIHRGAARYVVFDLTEYYYRLDWKVPDSVRIKWHNPVLVSADVMDSAQSLRMMQNWNSPDTVVLGDAGWHFSCLGEADKLRKKLRSFSHSELDTPELTDLDYLAECIATGKDLLDRFQCEPVQIDSSFPRYVTENLDRFRHLTREGASDANSGGDTDSA